MSDYEIIYNLPHKKPAEDTCKQTKSKPEFLQIEFHFNIKCLKQTEFISKDIQDIDLKN